jgi:hypothetical protein
MSPQYHILRRRLLLLLASSCCAVVVLPRPLAAQETAPDTGVLTAPVTRTQNVTINLINRLVERGVLTKQDSIELIQMAEEDAVIAKAETETAKKDAVAAAVAALPAPTAAPAADADVVSVTYIPEYVKAQIKEEIRQDVMTTAADENWADPHSYPDWMANFRPSGDIRLRFESQTFPSGNLTGLNYDFNKINSGSTPYNEGTENEKDFPYYNSDQDRERARLRLRLASQINLGENFTTGVRIATGSDSSPVTQNQTLSGFSKYSLWLDRGFLAYEHNDGKGTIASLTAGRMDNPFFSPSSIIWANDIGFDGIALKARHRFSEQFSSFFTIGAFPVYNTDLNFGTYQSAKIKSYDKYLYGAQLGAEFMPLKDVVVKIGAAIYEYDNIEGKRSSPLFTDDETISGDTDASRPSFAQRGNTYMRLRDITPGATQNNNGNEKQYQYFGLATPFRELTFSARIDFNRFEPFQISLLAEGVRNLAFDKAAVAAKAMNNKGTAYDGGDTGWLAGIQVGSATLEQRWDWNVSLNFRHVESDAVVDGFADSDFGGGGTNVEGFAVGGNLAFSRNVWLGLRWMSASTIAGPEIKSDILQIDINGKF